MTGQINVNKIAARTGTTITIDTGDALDVTLVKGEGSATTNLKQGLAKSWFTKVQDGTSMKDNFNISTMTDQATGIFVIAFTNNHNNDDYAFTSSTQPEGNTTVISTCEINTEALISTSGYTGETAYVNSTNNRTDYDYPSSVVTHGDLA